MTKVVNTKVEKCDIFIGRPSKFGNPFRIGKDGTRAEVISKYRSRFYNMILDSNFRQSVNELKGKTLGCFCKPLPCHGDVIVEYLEQQS